MSFLSREVTFHINDLRLAIEFKYTVATGVSRSYLGVHPMHERHGVDSSLRRRVFLHSIALVDFHCKHSAQSRRGIRRLRATMMARVKRDPQALFSRIPSSGYRGIASGISDRRTTVSVYVVTKPVSLYDGISTVSFSPSWSVWSSSFPPLRRCFFLAKRNCDEEVKDLSITLELKKKSCFSIMHAVSL